MNTVRLRPWYVIKKGHVLPLSLAILQMANVRNACRMHFDSNFQSCYGLNITSVSSCSSGRAMRVLAGILAALHGAAPPSRPIFLYPTQFGTSERFDGAFRDPRSYSVMNFPALSWSFHGFKFPLNEELQSAFTKLPGIRDSTVMSFRVFSHVLVHVRYTFSDTIPHPGLCVLAEAAAELGALLRRSPAATD